MAHTVIETDELIEQGKFNEAIDAQTRRVKWLYNNHNKTLHVVDEKFVRVIVQRMQQQIDELKAGLTPEQIKEYGIEMFGDAEKYNRWLDTPNFALGDSKPADLMGEVQTRQLVRDELGRIAHGVLA